LFSVVLLLPHCSLLFFSSPTVLYCSSPPPLLSSLSSPPFSLHHSYSTVQSCSFYILIFFLFLHFTGRQIQRLIPISLRWMFDPFLGFFFDSKVNTERERERESDTDADVDAGTPTTHTLILLYCPALLCPSQLL
jgi:hypothetical protein